MPKIRIAFYYLLLAFFPALSSATIYNLYDSSLASLPSDQPWLTSFSTSGSSITNSSPGVNLQSSTSEKAGFSNYPAIPLGYKNANFPLLDSTTGFTLSFTAQINSEQHLNSNRSGFSVILLDKNSKGVELGFWENAIWSQSANPVFQAKDEQLIFDTKSSLLSYQLTFMDNNFFLSENETLLLTGALKDYTSFSGGPFGTAIPYSLPNYLFLGNNSSSASVDLTLQDVSLSDTPLFVPIPPSIGFMLLGLFSLFRLRPLTIT